jgi:hypothetical protein
MDSTDQEMAVSVSGSAIELVQSDRTAGRRAESYDLYFTGDRQAAIQTLPRGLQPQSTQRSKTPTAIPMPTAESRATFRSYWKAARDAAQAMVHAAQRDDRMSLGIAADDLELAMAKLWDIRQGHDIDWKTILNHMQGMMRLFFQEKRAESLTTEQCKNIAILTCDYLGPATKTTDDLNEALRLIEDSGFDPYAAISGDLSTLEEE